MHIVIVKIIAQIKVVTVSEVSIHRALVVAVVIGPRPVDISILMAVLGSSLPSSISIHEYWLELCLIDILRSSFVKLGAIKDFIHHLAFVFLVPCHL